jgi:hypothetical protein
MRSIWLRGLVLALALSSCAVSTPGVEPNRSMPAARAGLRPEYRIFYDTLNDYGQWLLIEPMGYVFRPQLDFNDWRPYSYGFWAPSDAYGWVWVSSEPYGWATYHYGRWYYDDFQGWVWIPGAEWGPAWVAWEQTGPYVGWAPLGPGSSWNQPQVVNAPGGSFVFCSVNQLGSTTLDLKREPDLGSQTPAARLIERSVLVDGVRAPAGPSIEAIERAAGRTLPRVKITDLLQTMEPGASSPRTKERTSRPTALDRVVEARRAGEQAATETKGAQSRGGLLPARVPVVRPNGLSRVFRRGAAAHDTADAESDSGRR